MNFRNRDPYAGLDWSRLHRIMGCTHLHCTDDREMQKLFADGLEFVTLSNYHPSAPWYPLREMRQNGFRRCQKGYTKDGAYRDEEIDFSAQIEGWKETLAPENRQQLPFSVGEDRKSVV